MSGGLIACNSCGLSMDLCVPHDNPIQLDSATTTQPCIVLGIMCLEGNILLAFAVWLALLPGR